MSEIDKVTGQVIDYKEHNDNAPPSYSSPSAIFKSALRFHADKNCSRCRGTGYIGSYKGFSGGRCFLCLPDDWWNNLLGEVVLTGTDNNSGEPVCEIRFVSPKAYSTSGYVVTKVGIPPTYGLKIFPTIEDACKFASEVYGV